MVAIKFDSNKFDRKQRRMLSRSKKSLDKLYEAFYKEVAKIGATTGFDDPERDFFLKDYPKADKAMQALLRKLCDRITGLIEDGCQEGWSISNAKNSALINALGNIVPDRKDFISRVNMRSESALNSFQGRKVNGMGLSERVWKSQQQVKGQIELALELGLAEGKSAPSLSRDVRSYLREPERLFRRVRDKKGHLRLSKSAAAYHPGQGVYRSSYKNALRMTVTENNIAYRTADFVQQQEMDFVIGIEIRLSDNHPCDDICDDLAGVYPKKFKFTGWHPFCRCYTIPKLAEREELNKWARMSKEERAGYHFKGEVRSMPKKFTDWVDRNAERIKSAKSLPYFIKDNSSLIKTATITSDELSELASMLGVDAGEPMTHKQADMKHPNPHYGEAVEYGINCQSTVVAYELRRRGLPVEAYGTTIGCMGEKLAYNTRAAWIDENGNMPTPIICYQKLKSRTVDRRGVVHRTFAGIDEIEEEFLSQTSEKGRYHLLWFWKGKNTGHIITMETTKYGTRLFYDPQTGRKSRIILPWISSEGKVVADLLKGISVYRVDNLRPNPLIVKGIVKKAGSTDVAPSMTTEQKEWWAKNVEKKATGGANGHWSELYDLQKIIKASDRFPISEKQEYLNVQTHYIENKGRARKFFIDHCRSKEELAAAEFIWNNPQHLEFVKSSKLGEGKDMTTERAQKNIAGKEKRKVLSYNLYQFDYNKKKWKVKVEVYENSERFYSIVK